MKESKLVKGVVTIIAVVAFSIPAIATADTELKGKSEKVSFSDLGPFSQAGCRDPGPLVNW